MLVNRPSSTRIVQRQPWPLAPDLVLETTVTVWKRSTTVSCDTDVTRAMSTAPPVNIPPSVSSTSSNSNSGGGFMSTSVELLVFGIVAVLVQLSIALCLCIISCRQSYRWTRGSSTERTDEDNGASTTAATTTRDVDDDTLSTDRCLRPLSSFFQRLLSRFSVGRHRRRRPTANGTGRTNPIAENDAAVIANAFSGPPPSYEEALAMPRTAVGHVVLFQAGNDGDGRCDRIYFRFTMNDDPTGPPPSFAEFVTVNEGEMERHQTSNRRVWPTEV